MVKINRHNPGNSYYSPDNIDNIESFFTSKRREVNNMKKWVALVMALSFALSVTSVTLAQDAEQFQFRSGDKIRMEDAKKKGTFERMQEKKQEQAPAEKK
jgi:hypothetical protein